MSPWDILGWMIVGLVGLFVLILVLGIVYGLVRLVISHIRDFRAQKNVRRSLRTIMND